VILGRILELIKRLNKQGKNRKISPKDSLMSALAMFSLKSPSLLAFDQARKNQVSWDDLFVAIHLELGAALPINTA
jgi:hypothetical protein